MEKIKIKYFSEDYPRLEKLDQGDWIDLRVDSIVGGKAINMDRDFTTKETIMLNRWFKDTNITYQKGDILFLGLGIAMELPSGYEAYIVPRSSTFKKTGLLLTNGIGIIDNAYCGDNDEWKAMVIATRDGFINRHDRLFQFRIQKKQPKIEFEEVKILGNKDRGGYGSTDKED